MVEAALSDAERAERRQEVIAKVKIVHRMRRSRKRRLVRLNHVGTRW